MARPPGTRNRDYEATRHALARAAAARLLNDDGEPATLKDFADAAGVTQPTLKHYFGDRDGVIRAAMESVLADARPYLDAPPKVPASRSVDASLVRELRNFVRTWRDHGVGKVIGAGLAIGLHSESHGPLFITTMLEPTLQWYERLLELHVARGDLEVKSVRFAALALLGPMVLALLHQDGLHGDRARPLDVDAMVRPHVRAFLDGARGKHAS